MLWFIYGIVRFYQWLGIQPGNLLLLAIGAVALVHVAIIARHYVRRGAAARWRA